MYEYLMMGYHTRMSTENTSIRSIFLIADQPWQTLVMREISIKLKEIRPEFRSVIVTSDYFTFIHGKNVIADLDSDQRFTLETQEEMYGAGTYEADGSL